MKLKWVENLQGPLLKDLLPPSTSIQTLIAALYDDEIPVAAGYATINDSKIQIENPYFVSKSALETFLKEIEIETQKRNLLSSILLYSDQMERVEELQEILQKASWSEPEKWMINCYFDHTFNPPWLNKEYKLPPAYNLVPWKNLTPDQISILKHKGTQFVYPLNLSPFMYADSDPEYSLCLLHDNEVVGWMITRKINANLISFDSFFVEYKYRQPNIILDLLSSSVKGVLNSSISNAIMEVNLMQTDNSYINFVYKRYIPYIERYNYTLRSWKLINS